VICTAQKQKSNEDNSDTLLDESLEVEMAMQAVLLKTIAQDAVSKLLHGYWQLVFIFITIYAT